MVFHRRSRQGKPCSGPDSLHRLGAFCGGIFNALGLVNDLEAELLFFVPLLIPFQKLIGGDHYLVLFHPRQQLPALAHGSRCRGGL